VRSIWIPRARDMYNGRRGVTNEFIISLLIILFIIVLLLFFFFFYKIFIVPFEPRKIPLVLFPRPIGLSYVRVYMYKYRNVSSESIFGKFAHSHYTLLLVGKGIRFTISVYRFIVNNIRPRFG
jgi:hypothetical protein